MATLHSSCEIGALFDNLANIETPRLPNSP
jgi:hypothetical protein